MTATTRLDSPAAEARGPLAGLRVIEFAGIGPGPFAAMLLSDMGADIVRIDRPGAGIRSAHDIVSRGRRVVELDIRTPAGAERALDLTANADALIEGFRPGVMERLGLGPDAVLARNPRLIYGRLTGWGQDGPLAHSAGHDINYIALGGALAAFGPAGREPQPPMNLVGDYGGGSLYLVSGILAAIYERQSSGRGQVIDAAVMDGTASLMALYAGRAGRGDWQRERGVNMLDGVAHYYRSYETSDGRYMAVGAIEPKFFETLCRILGVDVAEVPQQPRERWALHAARFEKIFRSRTRAEWTAAFDGTDACVAPVLDFIDGDSHPHVAARRIWRTVDGVTQPAPAPRFSRSGVVIQGPPPNELSSAEEILGAWNTTTP